MPIGGFAPTAKFLSQLQSGAVVSVYTEVDVYTPQGSPVPGYQDIPISQMTVTANRTNVQRTTCSLTVLVDKNTFWPVPTDLTSPFSPNGNELYITTGFTYSDGTQDTFLQGKFPIVSTVVQAEGNLTMAVSADDRAWSIGRRGLLSPFTTTEDNFGNPTESISDTIYALLTQNVTALPAITYSIQGTDQLAPANTYSVGQDPWQASQDLATGYGCELYVDPNGNVVAATPPTSGNPVWTFSTYSGDLMAITADRTLTADDVYNDFIVVTANSDSYDYFATSPQIMPPVQATVSDSNPSSPTYTGGNFGNIPQFIQSSVSTNQSAAEQEATLDLALSLGSVDMLQLVGPINPAVQIDDFCTVYIPRLGLASPTLYVVDGFTSDYEMTAKTTYQLRRVIS